MLMRLGFCDQQTGVFKRRFKTRMPFQQGIAPTTAFARLIGQMAFVRVCIVQE